MNALATLAVDPAPIGAGLRLFQIVGDGYEPELRGGSFVMVAPAERFSYDSEYLLDFGDGEGAYRAASCFNGEVEVWHPNPLCSRWRLPRGDFNRAVTAIVVAEVRIKNERLMDRRWSGIEGRTS